MTYQNNYINILDDFLLKDESKLIVSEKMDRKQENKCIYKIENLYDDIKS